jgi:hypothetical protein
MSEPTHDTTPNDTRPRHDPDGPEEQSEGQVSEGQVSEGPSGFGSAETSGGGADAVPDTPDANPGTSAPIRGSRD